MSSLPRRSAHEVHLADLDADMAQDRVGRGGVEEEVREREAEQVLLALEGEVTARRLHHDIAGFAAVDLFWREALDVRDRLGDTGLEIGEACFGIGERWRLN